MHSAPSSQRDGAARPRSGSAPMADAHDPAEAAAAAMQTAPGKPGLKVSPLATPLPHVGEIGGVSLATARAGFYKHERPDVMLMRFPKDTACAGVFTKHEVGSSPVDWDKAALEATGGLARALVCNAGCANSFTGEAGARAVRAVTEAVSAEIGCREEEVMVASTGVIGVLLQAGKILNVLPELNAKLDPAAWPAAAGAIMTTDTFPKAAVREFAWGEGRTARIAGIAKGSGMIAPNMATMLAFAATDAPVAPAALQAVLDAATPHTWNAVTVDGDRSTNDTCLLFATGAAGGEPLLHPDDARLPAFRQAVEAVMLELAQALVRDGEGATKFVRVEITGAVSDASAARIARQVCESPLVKTALAGEDANWGRIAMAVGSADEPVDRTRLSIRFGPLWAARDGAVSPDYDEAAMSAYMKRAELEIAADVGAGPGRHVMWTCDLTKEYVAINGDYRS